MNTNNKFLLKTMNIFYCSENDKSALTQPFFFISSKRTSIKRFSTPRIRKIFNERRNFVVLSPENE